MSHFETEILTTIRNFQKYHTFTEICPIGFQKYNTQCFSSVQYILENCLHMMVIKRLYKFVCISLNADVSGASILIKYQWQVLEGGGVSEAANFAKLWSFEETDGEAGRQSKVVATRN